MINITDDPSVFPTVVCPDGSDNRNATTEAAMIQTVANRTAYL